MVPGRANVRPLSRRPVKREAGGSANSGQLPTEANRPASTIAEARISESLYFISPGRPGTIFIREVYKVTEFWRCPKLHTRKGKMFDAAPNLPGFLLDGRRLYAQTSQVWLCRPEEPTQAGADELDRPGFKVAHLVILHGVADLDRMAANFTVLDVGLPLH